MSTDTRSVEVGTDGAAWPVDTVRVVALGGIALLISAYASVFYSFVDIAPTDPIAFLAVAAGTLLAATALSSRLDVRTATAVAAVLLTVGLAVYIVSLPRRPPVVPLLTDAVVLMTGRSLLQVTNVDLWVLGVAPAPLFLTWYLALRRRYVSAVLAGGAALGFVVLTGDAANATALVGVVGAITAVAVGDMDRRGDSLAVAEPLAVLLAAMVLLAGIAPLVPGGPSRTADGWSSFQTGAAVGEGGTVEANLVEADNQVGIAGNLSLSPEVRFRVRSSESSYWRVGSYDRYTGDGWIRTGNSRSYRGGLDDPPGQSRTVEQEYELVDSVSVLPSVWKPVSVGDSVADRALVTNEDGLDIDGSLEAGERYSVRSEVPVAGADQLRNASTDYPDAVAERYTRVPSSTPDRLAERTARIAANADNPYDTAQVVERWLESNKEYSLNVSRPRRNIADSFVFEMDAGYCTYFATAMTVMLRSQDIPTRFVSGYTPGERVARDEWVVRGYDAHAWVEVYFPETGWVRFDPTPAGPRQATERQELNDAREANRTDVDLGDTGGGEWTPTETATPAPLTLPPQRQGDGGGAVGTVTVPPDLDIPEAAPNPNITINANRTTSGVPTNATSGASGGGGGSSGGQLPTREEATLGAIVVVGLAVGLRRSGLAGQAYRAVWLRYQPREDPLTDAEGAFERLEVLLAERHRPRRPDETVRQYLDDIGAGGRAREVAHIRERARYRGAVTAEEADRAVSLVGEIVSE